MRGGVGGWEHLVRLGCQGWRVALGVVGCYWVPAGDAGMTGARRARDGGWARLGMCLVGRGNVFSFGADVSSFRANVSSSWPNVFSFDGDVSTLAGAGVQFWVGRPGWGWGTDGRRDSSAPLRCARNDRSGGVGVR